jgi:lysozyme family protein
MENNKDLFKKALKFVLAREGGYCNNPNDRGGATNKGITQNTYNSYMVSKGRPTRDVRNITDAEVEDIYYSRYWLGAGCDKMSSVFAVICFDTAVNMGVGRVKPFLQACQYSDPDVFILERIRKYNEFAKTPSQRGFLHGWLNRVFALVDFVKTI